MTALPQISGTNRWTLKALKLERSTILPAGKIMWCRGRKILGYGTPADLANVFGIPRGTDTIIVSEEDYDQVKGWLG